MFTPISKVIFFANFLVTNAAEAKQDWNHFKATFDKTYGDSGEETDRKEIFTSNLQYISNHNLLYQQGLSTFTMAINNFSDWTTAEFESYLSTRTPPSVSYLSGLSRLSNDDTKEEKRRSSPMSLDWREHGIVTAIKDQGTCGGAGLFAELATVESVWAKETGNLIDLSVKQLIDCGPGGCSGGRLGDSYQTIIDMGGIMAAEDYPMQAEECSYEDDLAVAHISSIGTVPSLQEEQMVETLYQKGPISVAIEACRSFQHYHSGVYYDPSCGTSTVNHEIVLVGYDKAGTEETNYWIGRNSWGTGWGEGGYIKMRMWTNTANLARYVFYPVI